MSTGESRTGTILVAEDQSAMRELVKDILESVGYKVISVVDGEAAVATYIERESEIDLVILDMIMPRLGGGEAFRKLKSVNPGVLVLISSGYNHDENAQRLLNEGVAGFLGKPFQVGELVEKVRQVLDRKTKS
jgi:CheY-like chemotaxis protein